MFSVLLKKSGHCRLAAMPFGENGGSGIHDGRWGGGSPGLHKRSAEDWGYPTVHVACHGSSGGQRPESTNTQPVPARVWLPEAKRSAEKPA